MKILKIFFFVLTITCLPFMMLAQPGRKQVLEGNKLYQEQKYDEANNKYRDALVNNPNHPIIHFNVGDTQYKKKNYEEALKDYEKSLSIDDIMTQSKTYYNMGNAFYRAGKLPEAILGYTQALKLNPDDEDAKYNLEFVRAKLKEQAQKQPQSGQQQQQQKQQQQQGQDQQEKKEEQQQDQKEQSQEQESKEEQRQEQQQDAKKEKQQMTKEEAERILNALKEDKKDLKDKQTSKSAQVRVLKDW